MLTKQLKLIFLDIDGVLINREALKKGAHQVDSNCVKVLNELTDRTNAYIVLSSTYRIGKNRIQCCDLLRNWGVTGKVLDRTPVLGDAKFCRRDEINTWFSMNRRYLVESFVILDEDVDMKELFPHLVKTNRIIGLTKNHIEIAKKILDT